MKILTVLINQHYRDKVTLRENKLKKKTCMDSKNGKARFGNKFKSYNKFF